MIMFTSATVASVLLLIYGSTVQGATKPVVVDLYYESLCPDSVRFISNQLKPTYESLHKFLKINYVPYGKATHKKNEATQQWVITCQHGEQECKRNREQASVLREILDNKGEHIHDYLSLHFVSCVMESIYPLKSIQQCANGVGVSRETYDKLAEDVATANELVVEHGEKTGRLQPPLTFVPTVVINGEKLDVNDFALFKQKVCDAIPADVRPEACK